MRLILDEPAPGRVNMERDEALLARKEPVVRLYGWAPEAVSLGSSQDESAVDLEAVRSLGLEVVARRTGGGGILHHREEVTYAVVLPLDWPGLPRDIPGSFAYLSAGVVAAFRALGLPAEIESVPDATRDALCYTRRQGTNVVVRGRKISGGAQTRTLKHVLQHGTVIVADDAERMAQVFRTSAEAVRAKVTSLAQEGISVPRGDLIGLLARSFAEALGPLDPDPDPWR